MRQPTVVIIAAVARENRCIGKDMDLPWYLPEDLKRFKRLTSGHPLIMGRRTFTTILRDFGRPLPGRRTLVLTRQDEPEAPPCIEAHKSLSAALQAVRESELVFIAGGAEVYREALPIADRLELTLVDGRFEGDTFFPPYEHLLESEFVLIESQLRNGYTFMTWERVRK